MKEQLKKALSFILCFVVLCSFISITAAHATNTSEFKAIAFDNDQLHDIVENNTSEPPYELLQKLSLRDSDIPESMEYTDIRDTDAVARLKTRERDMSSLVYLNRDGTYTEYSFSENVKYEKDGVSSDKSNKLTSSPDQGGYVNEENDINVRLPYAITKDTGIELSYRDYSIEFIPLNTEELITKANRKKEDTVVYNNAFGEGVSLEYTAQFSGIKENIILSSNVGVFDFAFTVKTHGLYLKTLGDYAVLYNNKDEMIAEIGGLIIFDAKGTHGSGSFKTKVINPGEEYIYIVSVSEEFIKSDYTVFPVTIDPPLTYTADSNNIVSVGVTSSSVNYFHSTFSIGTLSSITTRMAVRFDYLKDRLGQLINANDIVVEPHTAIIDSVNLKIYATKNTSNPASTTISAFAMTQYWNEIAQYTATESNAIYSGYDNELSCSSTLFYIAGGMTLSFDITEMVNLWMYNETDYVTSYKAPYGVLIKMNNETDSCIVFPNTVSYNKPYITINYKKCAFYSQKEYENIGTSNAVWYNSYFNGITFKVGEDSNEKDFYKAIRSSGCYLMSFAMLLNNMNATTSTAHTIGTLYDDQILDADPISVIFANHQFPDIINNVIQNSNNATDVYRDRIASAFDCTAGYMNVTGYNLSEKRDQLNTLLRDHPEGIIIEIPDHYMLVMRKYDNTTHCYLDSEYFAVDPAKKSAVNGFNVVLNTQATSSSSNTKALSTAKAFIYLNHN